MYTVKFYKGDYARRQREANEDGCAAYVEQHFNSVSDKTANSTFVITGANASETSRDWGRWYASAVSSRFDIPIGGDNGIVVGGYDGRGDFNLRFTNMPAILLEPMFASNPEHAEWIRSDDGQASLAEILVKSVQRFFPGGGQVGLSVGHKYKTSNPDDRGAKLAGGGWEADYAEKVLLKAENLFLKESLPLNLITNS